MEDPIDPTTQEIDGSSRTPVKDILRRAFSLLALCAVALALILYMIPYVTAVFVAQMSALISLPLTIGYFVMICISSGPDNVKTTTRDFVRALLLFMAGIALLWFTTVWMLGHTNWMFAR